MKTTQEAKSLLQELRSEAEELSQIENMTEAQLTRLEQLVADDGEIAAAQREVEDCERLAARKREIATRYAGKLGSGQASKEWRVDASGRKYAVLKGEDKATDYTGRLDVENGLGHYVLAGVFGKHPSGLTPERVSNALGENAGGQAGGFLVPGELFAEVWDLARSRLVLPAAGMRTILMESSSITIPRLTRDVTIANHAENEEIPPSNMQFTAHQMVTHTAAARQEISRELWEDAPDLLAGQIEQWLIAAMADKVHEWGLVGTGSDEPNGILVNPDIGKTGSIGAVDWTDISAALLKVRENNHEPTAAIMSPANLEALQTIDAGNGTDSTRAWLMEPASVSGRSLFSTTKCPNSKIIVGDFSNYLMGMRTQPLVEATQTGGDSFRKHQVHIKITMRLDFVVMDPSAFHVLDGVAVS